MPLVYDDEASVFFAITMLVMYLVPATIAVARRVATFRAPPRQTTQHARSRVEATKLAALDDAVDAGKRVLWTRGFTIFAAVTAVLWITVLVLAFRVRGTQLAAYDPYAILGINVGSTERQIKSAYRHLSLQFHPDKPGGNAELFQKIAKAYEALTDPIARRNFELHGNPDGRQALEVAFGLPQWLVTGFTKWIFVASYVAVLCVVIPVVMFYSYRSGREKGPNGMHPATFEWLKYRIGPDVGVRQLPAVLAGCWEFGQQQPMDPRADSEKLGPLLNTMVEEGRCIKPTKPERSVVPAELILRNDIVIHAHLNRRPLGTRTLEMLQANILRRAEAAMALMLEITVARCLAHPSQRIPSHLEAAFAVVEFGQLLTQALYVRDSSLRTIFPTDSAAKHIAALPKKAGGATTLLQWLRQPIELRNKTLEDYIPDAVERAEAARIADDLPNLNVQVDFAVLDEDYIAEADVVTATVTMTHTNLIGAGPNGTDKPIPPVYAPHFPIARREEWYLLLTNASDKLIAMKTSRPGAAVAKETMQFLAPEKAGRYTYRLHVLSNAYAGLDQVMEIPFEVKPKADIPVFEEHDEDVALDAVKDVALESFVGGGAVDDSDTSDDEGGGGSDSDDDSDTGGKRKKLKKKAKAKASASASATKEAGIHVIHDTPQAPSSAGASVSPAKKTKPKKEDEDEFAPSILARVPKKQQPPQQPKAAPAVAAPEGPTPAAAASADDTPPTEHTPPAVAMD